LRQMTSPYDVAMVDIEDHDSDRHFSTDPAAHTGRKGWAYVDEALDLFFHDKLR
jgi:poly-D-alanine transfer protein DltD